MKNLISITAVIAIFSLASCSAYKAGQTPDDVYFSPGKTMQLKQDVEYQEYQSYNDDQYLRMKVQNNDLWSSIDDYNYWYDSRYTFGLMNYYSPNYLYYGFNNFYSPYYSLYNPYSFYSGFGLGFSYGWGMYNPVYVAAYYKNPEMGNSRVIRPASTSASNIAAYGNKRYSVINNGYSTSASNRYNNSNVNNNETYRNNFRNVNYGNQRNQNTYTPSNASQNWSQPVRVSNGGFNSNAGGVSGGVTNRGGGGTVSGGRGGR